MQAQMEGMTNYGRRAPVYVRLPFNSLRFYHLSSSHASVHAKKYREPALRRAGKITELHRAEKTFPQPAFQIVQPMNHTSSIHKNALLFLLPIACAGLLAACTESRGPVTETTIAAVVPPTLQSAEAQQKAAADSNYIAGVNRQASYTKVELDSAKGSFKQMFVVGNALDPVSDIVQRIPWKEIRTKGKTAMPLDKGVAGLHISDGLKNNAFHPIFRFMYHKIDGASLSLAPKAFSFDHGILQEEADPDMYEQAYQRNIRIDRLGNGTFSPLVPADLNGPKDHADPYAIWFPYTEKLNNLMENNSAKDTMLVVSCISGKYPYRAIMALADVPEYRHLLALHVGDGNSDLLTSGPPESARPYHDQAMDMGIMCPPNYPH